MEFLDTEPMVRAIIAPVVRLQERVADRIGLQLAAAAGRDPISALGFFDKSAVDAQDEVFPAVHDLPVQRKSARLQDNTSFQAVAAMFHDVEMNCAP
jgi:predicted Zn-dependent protease